MKHGHTPPDDRPRGLTHNPFAALRPAAAPGAGEPAGAPPPAGDPPAALNRVVVRRETKGRAGKTVTRVSGLGLAPDALAELARELKRALGCGASVDAQDVLLQGALTGRAAAWLRERRRLDVTIGN